MNKQKMNRWYCSIALLLILNLYGCQPQPDRLINQQIDIQIQKGSKEIRIADITNFTWTKMYIFKPYTPAALVDRSLGFEWPEYKSVGIENTDSDDLLVFVSHDTGSNRVVKFTKCPRSFGNFSFRQETNGYGYSPAQAVFVVGFKAENKLLIAINEPKKPTLLVTDVEPTQPGIYHIEAWFPFTQQGKLSIKVVKPNTNRPVIFKHSKFILKKESPQVPDGWSEKGTTLFPYRAEIMIQEGNWDRQYATRWELWQQQPNGKEQKLMETTRLVNGWER
jgi:hypothetical protein